MTPKLWLLTVVLLPLCICHFSFAQTLWGMSSAGGSKGNGGNLFSLNTDGTGFLERYAFLADGSGPYGQRLLDYGDGFLYGVAGFDGSHYGVLYKMHPDGSAYQVIYAFTTATGNNPIASIMKGQDGYLYGTTITGGMYNYGVIYKIDTNGAGYQVLHVFNGADGQMASREPVQLGNGDLYGITENGGTGNKGVVYKIKPDGSGYQLVHQFTGTDGRQPISILPVTTGGITVFYGNTFSGGTYGGVIFKMYPDGSGFQVQLNAQGGMYGPLVKIGNLLCGVSGTDIVTESRRIFSYNISNAGYQILHQFPVLPANDPGESRPNGVIEANGALFGTTEFGGSFNKGALFTVNTNGSSYQKLYSYSKGTSFINLAYIGSQLYGLTATSSATEHGTIYKIGTNGAAFQTIHSFANLDGSGPTGSLIRGQDGNLYGIAGHSIVPDPAWVFRIHTNGTGFAHMIQLHTSAMGTLGSLVQGNDGSFYGMSNDAGPNNSGNFFKFKQYPTYVTSQVFNVFGFLNEDLSHPTGTMLIASDGLLYGMTPKCLYSSTHYGGIFKINTLGTGYTVTHLFSGTDGANPNGSLIQAPDGFLYGMTENGGAQDWGVIFKIKPDGSFFQVLFQFGQGSAMYTGANGTHPRGSLLLTADGKLYGMAYGGGTSFSGTVFNINTNGTGFQVIHQFNYTDGALPNGSLIQASDGWFYGMTDQGGINSYGTIFKLNASGSVFQKLLDFDGVNGKYPKGDLLLVQPPAVRILGNDSLFNKKMPAANNTVSFEILPNPVHDVFNIHFRQTPKANFAVLLKDAEGKTLKQEMVQGTGGELYFRMQMNKFSPGIYIVQVTVAGFGATKKIIKQ